MTYLEIYYINSCMNSNINSKEFFYSPNAILRYRFKVKENEKMKELFLKIRNEMPYSTYRIKNQSIKNNNKWFCKKFTNDEEKVKKKINGFLNKFTDKNYKEISNDILQLKIHSLSLLTYLTDNYIDKTISENYYIKYWSYLLEKIIFNNKKWNFESQTFLTILLDRLQQYFENIISDNYSDMMIKLKEINIKEYYSEKKRNVGFAFLLCKLFRLQFINIKLLNKCLGELLTNYNNSYHMSIAIIIINDLNDSFDEKYKQLYNSLLEQYSNDENINKKIKFMILDYLDGINSIIDNQNNINNDDIDIEIKVKSYLDEYLVNNNYQDIIYYLRELSEYQNKHEIIYEMIIYSINLNQNKKYDVLDLMVKLLNDSIIHKKYLNEGLFYLLKEYDELKLDFPSINDTLIEFFKKLKKSKLMNLQEYKNIHQRANFKSDLFNVIFN